MLHAEQYLGKIVYYMVDNRIHSARCTSVMIVRNEHDDWCHTPEQRQSWQPFGPTGAKIGTCHGTFDARHVYGSKADLLASLE